MIPAAGIKDQDLAVIAEGSRIDDPTVAWRRHLGTGPGCDCQPFFSSAELVRGAKFTDSDPADRKRQPAARLSKRNRRGKPARIVQSRHIHGFAGLGLVAGGALGLLRGALGALDLLFGLGN